MVVTAITASDREPADDAADDAVDAVLRGAITAVDAARAADGDDAIALVQVATLAHPIVITARSVPTAAAMRTPEHRAPTAPPWRSGWPSRATRRTRRAPVERPRRPRVFTPVPSSVWPRR